MVFTPPAAMLRYWHPVALMLLAHASHEASVTRAGLQQQPGITIGGVIQLGLSAASDALKRAQAYGPAEAVNVALEAQSTFVQARTAYAAVERKNFNELSPAEQRSYLALEGLRHGVMQLDASTMTTVSDDATAIEEKLPYHGRHPIVHSFVPQYAPDQASRYRVRFVGVFPASYAGTLVPSVRMGGRTFVATERTTEELVFELPIPSRLADGADPLSNTEVRLLIPWDAGRWYDIGSRRRTDTASFAIAFAHSPPKPGH